MSLAVAREQIEARWLDRLTEAQRRYAEAKSDSNYEAYRRVLHIFTDLVAEGKIPEEP